MQQYLPLAVLKHIPMTKAYSTSCVATVLTACGIETYVMKDVRDSFKAVATVLTACGIETDGRLVMTFIIVSCNSTYRLRY